MMMMMNKTQTRPRRTSSKQQAPAQTKTQGQWPANQRTRGPLVSNGRAVEGVPSSGSWWGGYLYTLPTAEREQPGAVVLVACALHRATRRWPAGFPVLAGACCQLVFGTALAGLRRLNSFIHPPIFLVAPEAIIPIPLHRAPVGQELPRLPRLAMAFGFTVGFGLDRRLLLARRGRGYV